MDAKSHAPTRVHELSEEPLKKDILKIWKIRVILTKYNTLRNRLLWVYLLVLTVVLCFIEQEYLEQTWGASHYLGPGPRPVTGQISLHL